MNKAFYLSSHPLSGSVPWFDCEDTMYEECLRQE